MKAALKVFVQGRAIISAPSGKVNLPGPARLATIGGGQGIAGASGSAGDDGASAYEIAVANGFEGDVAAWLLSLKGEPGEPGEPGADSTVPGPAGDDGRELEIQNSGTYLQWRYAGEEDWANLIAVEDLRGEPGQDGNDGQDGQDGANLTEIRVDGGFIQWRGSEAGEWVNVIATADLKGDPGNDSTVPGPAGDDGASAYEIAVANGFAGDEAAWLLSLKGEPGEPGGPGADSTVPGPAGDDGASAYEIALANGFVGDEAAWLLSLKGEPGEPGEPGADSTVPGPAGDDGASAYEIALANGFEGDEAAWLLSLKGEPGEPGEPGADSTVPGPAGDDGREVEFQNSGTHIQWRYVGEGSWTNLVALSDITGPPGEDGEDGSGGGAEIYVRSSDFSDSTGTLSDVSSLAFDVAANEVVFAEISGFATASATGAGMRIAFTGTASPAHVRYSFEHYASLASLRTVAAAVAFGEELFETNGLASEAMFRVYFTLTNGSNAGTVQFQCGSDTGSTGITITRGAALRVYRQ